VPRIADGPLADVCTPQIELQLTGLPGVAVGPLFTLLGDSPVLDVEAQTASGQIRRADGTLEEVRLVLRAGGPAVEFRDSLDVLEEDPTLTLAHTSTASMVQRATSAPTTGVVALTDVSHDVIIWDPVTYPEIVDFGGLFNEQVEIRHVTDAPVINFLVSNGTLASSQMQPGFDGEPAAFVEAAGAIAQQVALLSDVALLPSLPQWARPVSYVSAADAGWASYDDVLVARSGETATLSDCLGRLVPIVQAAIVAYRSNPSPTNAVMASARAQFNSLSRITAPLLDAGAQLGIESGVFGVAGDPTVGDFDRARLDSIVTGLGDPIDVEVLAMNDFIDPSIR
jgi:hypothetical protein